MEELSYVFTQYFVSCVHVRSYFLLPLIFTLLAASISHCLTAALNFHVFLHSLHPRRPRGSQSGWEKRRDESFQVQAKEPLGTDSHRIIHKNCKRMLFPARGGGGLGELLPLHSLK